MRLAAVLAALLAACGAALAQDRPGDFDFYVLALSWSPSWCAAESGRAGEMQCSGRRPYAFIVHGLWPQYENGFPEYCDRRAARVPQPVVDGMLDLMPSPGLVIHQWRKHGTCAAGNARAYFETVRAARARVTVPQAYASLDARRTVSPGEVEAAFLAANPGLPADGVAVTCDGRRLREVRVCVTRDLAFRSCPEVDRRACRAAAVAMPPSR